MSFNTISINTDAPVREAVGSGTVYPGMLVSLTNAAADTVIAHNSSGGIAAKKIAIENELAGGLITDAYSSAARVFYKCFMPGDLAYVKIANGQNIAKADRLVSNGDGYWRKLTPYDSAADIEDWPLALALEAVDMSGSSGVDPSGFCVVEIL